MVACEDQVKRGDESRARIQNTIRRMPAASVQRIADASGMAKTTASFHIDKMLGTGQLAVEECECCHTYIYVVTGR